ncbi:UDP-N-acetylmuramoyl-tripeptide--D-alanyl-D-alanine ligase [Coriobacterium glomerans PW2]|uniref:UDP-N-acetylmuramoyl-tripeptide--D-alanyl-D-alanine ligase n=1 Tax=Coriobacterium glomerans (strain ATCC 49209 / DSM 20642 / JCM 10262 / PW2) TaxID=700015 RepID=F2NBR2_CORGP|nr:UDP-N-acetylmuramoyl-tripeptide--D-alanyl-D-alanine ligase [Coriobacterium glomerans]AEB06871.1 UDP-N-acetylmuramoyl-tripeptide--D-alanyl-D-alanine ligase [Coriobacterium glomerans PW2]
MIEITAADMTAITGSRLCAGPSDRVCRGCVIDSRDVGSDAVFVAFPGEHVDGNDFAIAAVQAGAGAVVLTREPSRELCSAADQRGCAVAYTNDAERFLLALAHDYRSRLGCPVVGITGSIGKTTTKDMVAALLSTRYRVHATIGNRNNLIGMPLTVLSAPEDTQALILEMGMSASGEIERLSRCAAPTHAIITRIGTSHIGMLGSRDAIARAKAEIVSGMIPWSAPECERSPLLVLSSEDDFTSFISDRFAEPAGVRIALAGTRADADVTVRRCRLDDQGCASFELSFRDGCQLKANLAAPGAHAVQDAALAAALAYDLGVSPRDMIAAFGALAITSHRQQIRLASGGAKIIDDSYNASPESMAAGLDLLLALSGARRRIAVLGEMGELGERSERMHALVGAYAAAKQLDLLVCVGHEAARTMADAARLMGMPAHRIEIASSAHAVLDRFGSGLGRGDLVLVKGSRFVGLDRFVEGVC